jgi:hypothetical protein
MAIDFDLLLRRASELYDVSPAFFNWTGGLLVAVVGGAWWLRGHFEQSEKNGLRAQVAALDQQLKLAKQQFEISERETASFKQQVTALQEQINRGAKLRELTNATTDLTITLGKVLAANDLVSGTLGSVGIGDIYR